MEPAPWEQDDQQERLVATVVFVGGAPGEFDYLVPDDLAESIQPGCRVRVPLGRSNRPVDAYCIRAEAKPPGKYRLKPVRSVVDARALLSPSMLQLTQWIAEHYLCDLGQVLETVVPSPASAARPAPGSPPSSASPPKQPPSGKNWACRQSKQQ